MKKSQVANFEKCSAVLTGIRHSERQRIINLLKGRKKPLNVNTMMSKLNMPQAVLSHHLSVLKNVHLVEGIRDGREVYYSANTEYLNTVLDSAEQMANKS